MPTILDKIAAYKREEVARAKALIGERELDVMALDAPPVRSFSGALENKIAQGQWALIAEIKKASPSTPWPMRMAVPLAFPSSPMRPRSRARQNIWERRAR
jgi:indole-3-glycerol phosphate synthase